MTIVIIGLCVWIGSIWWVIHDGLKRRLRFELILWVPLTIVLGPFAAAIYHTEQALKRPGKPATPGLPKIQVAPTRPDRPTRAPGSGTFVLVRSGPEAHRAAEIPLLGALVIGRELDPRSGASVLDLTDQSVSRKRHCLIQRQGSGLTVDDCSRHGTLVDGKTVHRASAPIRIGSVLVVGKTTLVICDQHVGATQVA